jgi:hypothetical protein
VNIPPGIPVSAVLNVAKSSACAIGKCASQLPADRETVTNPRVHTRPRARARAHTRRRERLQGRRAKEKGGRKRQEERRLQAKRQLSSIRPEGNRCKRVVAVHAACTNLVRHSPTDQARRERRSGSRSPSTPEGARGLQQTQHKNLLQNDQVRVGPGGSSGGGPSFR